MKRLGFTLMELLIVVSLVVILTGIVLMGNINNSLKKARDSTRKGDLNKLARIFEDYYNDHSDYPTNNPATGIIEGIPWGDPFPNYPINLPKDPSSPTQDYYYETDPNNQFYFAIYAKLEITTDDDIITVGCSGGCGPLLSFNYVVHSTNVQMLAGIPSGNTVGYPGFGQPPTPPPAATNTPVPTLQLTPPPVTPGMCGDNGPNICCTNNFCGNDNLLGSPPGAQCLTGRYCAWVPIDYSWKCYTNLNCP